MTVIYRNAGAWGAGKGAKLTSLEADGNFYDHELRIAEMEANPPSAVSIAAITVTGNQMTILLSDATTLGPFTLPSAQWAWKGEWTPDTVYFKNDVLSFDGAIYLVQHNHTSEGSFDPSAEDPDGFFYAQLLEAPQQPYDVGMYFGDNLPNDESVILQHVATRDFVITTDFGQSVAFLATAVTLEDLTLSIYKNDTLIGTLIFEIGVDVVSPGAGQFGTFAAASPTAEMAFSRTDRLIVTAPAAAFDTPGDLSITFAGRAGTIS